MIAAEGILSIIDGIARRFVNDKLYQPLQRGISYSSSSSSRRHSHVLSHVSQASNRSNDEVSSASGIGSGSVNAGIPPNQQYMEKNLPVNNNMNLNLNYNTNTKNRNICSSSSALVSGLSASNVNMLDERNNLSFLGKNQVDRSYVSLSSLDNGGFTSHSYSHVGHNHNYFATQPKESPIESADDASILSFSIIQLITDAHNTQIKEANKMKLESYKKNLRELNKGQDFAPKVLEKIYHSIVTIEIKTCTGNLRDIFVAIMAASYYDLPEPSYDPYGSRSGTGGDFKNDGINEDSRNNYNSKTDSNINHIGGDNDGSSVGGGNNNDDDLIEYSRLSGSYFWESEYMPLKVNEDKKSEWKYILKMTKKRGEFTTITPATNGCDVFNILWEPALIILEFHLEYAGQVITSWITSMVGSFFCANDDVGGVQRFINLR